MCPLPSSIILSCSHGFSSAFESYPDAGVLAWTQVRSNSTRKRKSWAYPVSQPNLITFRWPGFLRFSPLLHHVSALKPSSFPVCVHRRTLLRLLTHSLDSGSAHCILGEASFGPIVGNYVLLLTVTLCRGVFQEALARQGVGSSSTLAFIGSAQTGTPRNHSLF